MTSTQSKACCTVPPVVAEGYKEKGEYLTIEGMKTYATQVSPRSPTSPTPPSIPVSTNSGPKTAKSAILNVYDIFGFFPQTLQGADILAHADGEHQYQVFMPDFFDGKPADISWYPPDNEEKGKKLGEFFNTLAAPPKTLERIPKVLKAIQAERPDIKEWAIVGFCWGGKIVNLVSQEGTLFKAAAACHPAMVDAKDAPGITIPYAMFPSKDESKEDVEAWEKGLKVKNVVKWWPYVFLSVPRNQVHGFMAARADLKDEKVKADYTKAYEELLSFFHDNM
ncbi:hypothetical protein LTR91_011867 [Friedmanniomyces endolithicus]|uniref:Dienelactone hydrolase domain-containing protein n=1 Tax=Friedmanniomyces endolithicus TaxID=329885 RepID=A0AAN6KGS8_9PEZI|nr:hypothetical protein LTR94_006843 [Friedmanniomyces endolithicus]KAK0782700.1 hypothetical protein LTR59_012042 [Friedmanniomyces endolithicus]KAK0789558.1 hypothetical protein LTR38_010874 [Friedmanniomyces endolithicus]KAK0816749.1 hypothetical protein LTR75_003432 [Friedmanniomyces endolithicus]KAK0854114.1 hypothetical protein LTR03_002485 [Friedmanniomyces endolithicus]